MGGWRGKRECVCPVSKGEKSRAITSKGKRIMFLSFEVSGLF